MRINPPENVPKVKLNALVLILLYFLPNRDLYFQMSFQYNFPIYSDGLVIITLNRARQLNDGRKLRERMFRSVKDDKRKTQ